MGSLAPVFDFYYNEFKTFKKMIFTLSFEKRYATFDTYFLHVTYVTGTYFSLNVKKRISTSALITALHGFSKMYPMQAGKIFRHQFVQNNETAALRERLFRCSYFTICNRTWFCFVLSLQILLVLDTLCRSSSRVK